MKPPAKAEAADDASTGLPWPVTWRGVYVFVILAFLGWVALLAWLTASFP